MRIGAIAVCVLLSTGDLFAQQARVISSTPSCPRCAIDLTRVATLGSEGDAVGFAFNPTVHRDSRGRYLVAPSLVGYEILVYDARGRLLQTVGRRGAGPGEFRRITRIALSSGDTVHVLDSETGRWTVLSPEFRVVREVPFAMASAVQQAFVSESSGLVVQANSYSRPLAGLPIHRVDAAGRVLQSFGADAKSFSPGRPAVHERRIATVRGGGVVSAHRDRYRIDRWDAQGRLVGSLERRADWFPPWSDYSQGPFDEVRPKPMVLGVWEDAQGLLYVNLRVAATNWTPVRAASTSPRRERALSSYSDADRFVDSVLEILDPVRGVLVASARVTSFAAGFTPQGLLYSIRETAAGAEVIDVWQVQLRRPR